MGLHETARPRPPSGLRSRGHGPPPPSARVGPHHFKSNRDHRHRTHGRAKTRDIRRRSTPLQGHRGQAEGCPHARVHTSPSWSTRRRAARSSSRRKERSHLWRTDPAGKGSSGSHETLPDLLCCHGWTPSGQTGPHVTPEWATMMPREGPRTRGAGSGTDDPSCPAPGPCKRSRRRTPQAARSTPRRREGGTCPQGAGHRRRGMKASRGGSTTLHNAVSQIMTTHGCLASNDC